MSQMEQKSERNFGIDLLRVIAMFMIVMGHVVRFVFNYFDCGVSHTSANYIVMDILSNITLVGVNVYAMITGFLMIEHLPRVERLASLWFQMVFYGVGIAGIAAALHWGMAGRPLWKYCLPVTQNLWWYMTAYFGMFPFLPYLVKGVKSMSKHDLLVGGGILTIFFSIIPNFVRNRNVFQLEGGYSVVWLLVLFCLGAILHLCIDEIRAWLLAHRITPLRFLSGTVCCQIIFVVIFDLFGSHLGLLERGRCLYDSYTSPVLLLYGIALLLVFAQLDIRKIFRPTIARLSALTLPIYLIHVHPVIWGRFFDVPGQCQNMMSHTISGLFGCVVILAIGWFLGCAILGQFQVWLFQIIGRRK